MSERETLECIADGLLLLIREHYYNSAPRAQEALTYVRAKLAELDARGKPGYHGVSFCDKCGGVLARDPS